MQGFCRLPGCLQDSLLSSCHPKCVRTLYDAGAVSLPDLLRIIQEHEHAGNGFRPFRLRSAGGTFYKVVKNGKRPLADLLAGASVGDREADIEELVSAASKVYEKHFVAGLGEKMRSQDDVKHFLKKKTNCRFTQFAPLAHRPAGTYKRFFDCFEACDRAAGGVRGLRMRFNRLGAFRSAVINGREVHIPRNTQLVVRETPVPKDNGEMEKKLAVVMYAPLDKVFFPLVTVLSDGQAYFINAGLELEALVQCWEEDSVTASEVIGVACRHCLFCDRELVDPTSVARGIGPVCAKNFRSALKLITEPHTSGPVMGAHVQPQPQKAVNIALANGTSVALSIPPRLLKESAVLEGLLDCDGDLPDAAILNGLLGIDAATLDVLDRMLETPGWFPEAQDDIVSALAAADALGLAAPQRLLQMVFLEGSAELVVGTVVESTEVLAKAVVRRAIAKALAASLGESCELTPFKLPKRTLEIDTYVNLRSAIEKSDVEALQRMLAEGVSLARPTKLPQKYGNATLPSQAMSAPLEVADMLLAHGMDWPEEERKRALGHNWRLLDVFVRHGMPMESALEMVIRGAKNLDTVRDVFATTGARVTERHVLLGGLAAGGLSMKWSDIVPLAEFLTKSLNGAEISETCMCDLLKMTHTAYWLAVMRCGRVAFSQTHVMAAANSSRGGALAALLAEDDRYEVSIEALECSYGRNYWSVGESQREAALARYNGPVDRRLFLAVMKHSDNPDHVDTVINMGYNLSASDVYSALTSIFANDFRLVGTDHVWWRVLAFCGPELVEEGARLFALTRDFTRAIWKAMEMYKRFQDPTSASKWPNRYQEMKERSKAVARVLLRVADPDLVRGRVNERFNEIIDEILAE